MANPRDPVPAPAESARVNPDFPTIARPDPQNPVIAQQAVRVGEHEKMLADEAANPQKRVDAAKARVAAANEAVRVATEEAKAAELEAKRITGIAAAADPVDFGAPSPARPMGTAKDAKDFIDKENILTDEQAREQHNQRRAQTNTAEQEAAQRKANAEKAKMEADKAKSDAAEAAKGRQTFGNQPVAKK